MDWLIPLSSLLFHFTFGVRGVVIHSITIHLGECYAKEINC